MRICIVDLASIFYRLWHTNRDEVEFKIIGMLKTLQYDRVIIAVDAPPYKRKEVYPQYKANRDIPDPELIGCLKNVTERILKNGFQVAEAKGWEADDVVATLYNDFHNELGEEVFVIGVDKDLLQCCDIIDPFTGVVNTPESKFGIKRNQVVEYLSLVGDTSDNIKGVDGVGEKTAKNLLDTFLNVKGIEEAIKKTPEKFTRKGLLESLTNSLETVYSNMELIKLNSKLFVEYEQREVERVDVEETKPLNVSPKVTGEIVVPVENPEHTKYLVKTEQVSFSQSLEPVGIDQAFNIAKIFDKSGLYPRFKGAEQVMMILMRGRELGFGATTSLDLIEMIQGKPTMKAVGLLGKVMSSPKCEYITCTELSSKSCTWVTKRLGSPHESKRVFTIDDADKMGLTGKDNWKKQPDTMLQWRCVSALIRQVYPDLINGIYASEEFE